MANPRELALVVVIVTLFIGCAFSQSGTMSFHGIVLGANGAIPLDQAEVAPPVDTIGLAPPDATAEQLETRADELRARKAYLESMDYFRAALAKQPSAQLLNKMGIVELETLRLNDAKKSFERAIKLNKEQSDALNNLGMVYYEMKKYGKAIKYYNKAIAIKADMASYYSNL